MNTLAVDLGNTRWKAALVGDGRVGEVARGAYDDNADLADALRLRREHVQRALVASVASPARTAAVIAEIAIESGVAATPVIVSSQLAGVRPGYRKPEQLGIDRLLAMVAVRSMTDAPFCVIDAGTAVTLDFVDHSGLHLGGFILPGQQLSRASLLQDTAIPRDPRVNGDDVLGRDTSTGILLGSRYAVAAIAEMFLSGSKTLFPNQKAELYVGGGDADGIADALSFACIKLEHLVLRGLAVVDLAGDM